MSTKAKKDTIEEITGTANAYVSRLGFLIAALAVEDEVKESLLSLLPEMTPEQIERLSDILESAYLGEQTVSADNELKSELERIKIEYLSNKSELEGKTITKLEVLSGKLNQHGEL